MDLDQKPESVGSNFTCCFANHEALQLTRIKPTVHLDGCVAKLVLDDETNININQENKLNFNIATFI